MASVVPPLPAPSPPRRPGPSRGNPASSDALIAQRIVEAQSALWRAELSRSLLVPVVVTLLAITLWAAIDQWLWSPGRFVRSIALLSGLAWLTLWGLKRVWPLMSRQIRPEYAAHSLEHDLPELRHSLTSYVSLRGDQNREGVRGVVMRSIGARAAGQLKNHGVEVPSEAGGNLRLWLGVVVAIALAAGYAVLSPKDSLQSTKRLLLPLASIEAPSRVQISAVSPGDVEVLAGRPFDVAATIEGLSKNDRPRVEFGTGFLSSESLEYQNETGQHLASITVDATTRYRIVAGDVAAGPFEVLTRDVPNVLIDQVEITPPAYTGLTARSTHGGAIVGEENSIAKIIASTNRPIDRARIEFNPRAIGDKTQASGGVLDMTIDEQGAGIAASFPLRLPAARSGAVNRESYRIRVWDSAGNENPEPIVYPIRIIADLKPEIAIISPRAALSEVPINGAQKIEVQALDPDYGLTRVELEIRRGPDTLRTESLWSSSPGQRGNQSATWTLQPESLGLRIGETVQLIAIASDNRHDSDGTPAPNVVRSDSIELKVVERQENAKLPNLDQPPPQSEDPSGKSSTSDDAGSQAGDQNQSGQGQSGQGQSGQGQSGQGQSGQGQSGQGQSGQDPSGKQESGNGSSGGGASGEGRQGENDQSPPQAPNAASGSQSSDRGDSRPKDSMPATDGQQPNDGNQPSDGQQSSDGNQSSDGQQSSGRGGGESSDAGQSPSRQQSTDAPEDASTGPSSAPSEGQSGSQNAGAGQDSESPAGRKPEHDGDAFERIRDYINQSKKGDAAPDDADPDNGGQAAQKRAGQESDSPQQSDDRTPAEDSAGGADSSQKPGSESSSDAAAKQTAAKPADQQQTASGDQSSNDPQSDPSASDSPPAGKPGEMSSSENDEGQREADRGEPQPADRGTSPPTGESPSTGQQGSDQQDKPPVGGSTADKAGADKAGAAKAGAAKAGAAKAGADKAGADKAGADGSSTDKQGADESGAVRPDAQQPDATQPPAASGMEPDPSAPKRDSRTEPSGGTGGQSDRAGAAQEGQEGQEGKSGPDGKPSQDSGPASDDKEGQDGKSGQGSQAGQDGKGAGESKGQPATGETQRGMPPQAGNEPGAFSSPQDTVPQPQGGPTGAESKQDPGSPASLPSSGGEAGSAASDAASPTETDRPADPIDVEHARQATDLVLDYLDNQRETPDPELLERLDWTPEELRAFADRWNRLRGAEQTASRGDSKQIEDALRSLGIRSDQRGPIGRATQSDDALRGLRDAGNRTPAPAIHRDAFDAFRRNANRQ